MPRRARLVIPGCFFHVTQRGNYRQHIFDDDRDRITYLKYIQEYAQKYALDIMAYCLMENHVHFIVKPKKKDFSLNSFLDEAFSFAIQNYKIEKKKLIERTKALSFDGISQKEAYTAAIMAVKEKVELEPVYAKGHHPKSQSCKKPDAPHARHPNIAARPPHAW